MCSQIDNHFLRELQDETILIKILSSQNLLGFRLLNNYPSSSKYLREWPRGTKSDKILIF